MVDYYVDGAVGNDGNLGTSEGAGNAWATINYGLSQIADGDKLWVKASVTYNEFATIVTVGTFGGGISLEGYSVTPGDGGKVTIDAQNLANYAMFSSLGAAYYIISNFRFIRANVDGVRGATMDDVRFMNCEFTNNVIGGATMDDRCTFVNCSFTNNGQYGLSTGQYGTLIGCVIGNNGQNALFGISTELIYRTLIYGVPSGYTAINDSSVERVLGCTIVGEAGSVDGLSGVLVNADICDNIIEGFLVGIDNTASHRVSNFIGYNGMNNTTDYQNTRIDIGFGDVTGDMAFTDKGNDDYTLSGGSPAIDAGVQPGNIT